MQLPQGVQHLSIYQRAGDSGKRAWEDFGCWQPQLAYNLVSLYIDDYSTAENLQDSLLSFDGTPASLSFQEAEDRLTLPNLRKLHVNTLDTSGTRFLL